MNREKGIVLVATGNPYYGKMAYNLAVSIKAVEDIPIAVLFNGRALSHLNKDRLAIFDEVIEMYDAPAGSLAKLMMYNYSPFEKSLYIDSDNVWLPKKKPSELFKQLEGVKFTAITEGKVSRTEDDLNKYYLLWGDANEILDAYDLDEIYQWRTEVMYFEKDDVTELLFKEALERSEHPPLISVTDFAGSLPDEFFINIVASMLDIQPHKYRWQPAYWRSLHGNYRQNEVNSIYENYFILSTGGNRVPKQIEKLYNNIVAAAHNKLRLRSLFLLRPKATVLKERRTI